MRNENMGSKTRRGSAQGAEGGARGDKTLCRMWALKAEGSKLKGILTG
jgi:hypothetical protein